MVSQDATPVEPIADEIALVKAHLTPAPAELQRIAKELFLRQAQEYEAKVQRCSTSPRSWESALEEIDARFAHRLRVLAAEHLEKGLGLLAVGGLDYHKRIDNRKFLLWTDGRRMFDRGTDVLVVIDQPDNVLDELDRQFWNTRAAQLAEALAPFNARPRDERWKAIQAFLASRAAGKPDGGLFGVPNTSLPFLEIDRVELIVVPVFR